VDVGFGIVGDFALRFFGALERNDFSVLVTADEQGAGFAADAYARLRGFGAVFCTFGVGGLKLANAVAGAWAEQVPVLVVSGAPGVVERRDDPLLHHKVKSFDTQFDVFRDLTIAQHVLDNPQTAAMHIDRVIEAMLVHQRPGYLEIPRDMAEVEIADVDGPLLLADQTCDEQKLLAAVDDVLLLLEQAPRVVGLTGVMLARRGVAAHWQDIAEHLSLPVAVSALSRGTFPERHPLAVGVYQGAVSPPQVVEQIESADVVMSLGVLRTDLNMGGFTAHLDPTHLVEITDTEVTIGLRTYRDVPLDRFVPALRDAVLSQFEARPVTPAIPRAHHTPTADHVTIEDAIAAIADSLDERHGLIVDPGEAMFASVELPAPAWCLASAYYATMGYAVPASLGAGRADPTRRPVVLVGDGAFAMTGLECGWAAFHGVAPLVIVLDNSGYGTQRPMLDGRFNDIPPLRAELLPEVFGRGRGWHVSTHEDLGSALTEAIALEDLAVVRVTVPKGKPSAALTRLTEALRRRV
jgi:indolepyruvate decarboxylase